MRVRRMFVLLTAVAISLSLFSCSYLAYKDYYTKEYYANIWKLTGFRHNYGEGNVSPLFPQSLEDLQVEEFFCRYDQQLPLGEGVQVLLKVKYEDDLFASEVERISTMSDRSDEYFENSAFSAYSIRLGELSFSEYALVDENSKTVYYIILQQLPKAEIEFDHRLLPDGYTDYWDISSESSETD